jgi:hypothetical protein
MVLCTVPVIPRAGPVHEKTLEHFTPCFGRFVHTLWGLPDLHLPRLMPGSGHYVPGSGQAFRV